MTTLTFKANDIFEDIPDDPDNVIMNLPPELLEITGWKEGDDLIVEMLEGSLCIKKK
jgi:hypothetical protein